MGTLVLVRHGKSVWNLENRFTGWVDVPLAPQGRDEACDAAYWLKERGFRFDSAFTSTLVRAQETLTIMLEILDQTSVPTERSAALNERHYGALQGLNKAEMAQKYGAQQVKLWRRSYDTVPPTTSTEFNPDGLGESLQMTAARTLPYFNGTVFSHVRRGETILVSAHGNSLRSIVMSLDDLTNEEVVELNIDTGRPIVYDIDKEGKVLSKISANITATPGDPR